MKKCVRKKNYVWDPSTRACEIDVYLKKLCLYYS